MSKRRSKYNNMTAQSLKKNWDRESSRKKDKRKKRKKRIKYRDTKGFWEFGFEQKEDKIDEESILKKKLSGKKPFDPRKIDSLIDVDNNLNQTRSSLTGEKIKRINTLTVEETKYREDLLNIQKSIHALDIKTNKASLIKTIILLKIFLKRRSIHHIALLWFKLIYLPKNKKYFEIINDDDDDFTKNKKEKKLSKFFDKNYKMKDSDNNLINLRKTNIDVQEKLIGTKTDFLNLLEEVKNILDENDLIEIQFTKIYDQMPPLNEKGFVKLDDWQVEAVQHMRNNKNIIISAPTSAGKTVLSGYASLDSSKRVLYLVPTYPMVWQTASYLENFATDAKGISCTVPILSEIYKSRYQRNEIIEIINKSNILVATPSVFLDYMAKIRPFDKVIVDEIHMMGEDSCLDYEHIIKYHYNSQLILLSATIGNIDYLENWLVRVSEGHEVVTVTCNKRFINQQKYYYNKNQLKRLHPFSFLNVSNFEDVSVKTMSLNPTPTDIWDLYCKLKEKEIDLEEIDPYEREDFQDKWISLDDSFVFFNDMIDFIIENIEDDDIQDVINDYSNHDFENENSNLVDVALKIKEKKLTPAIMFIKDTSTCKHIAKRFSQIIKDKEIEKYPDHYNLLMDKYDKFKKDRKKYDREINSLTNKEDDKKLSKNDKKIDQSRNKVNYHNNNIDKNKLDKKANSKSKTNIEKPIEVEYLKPNKDFIISDNFKFSQAEIELWQKELAKWFKREGSGYSFVLDLLWRGIGVYAEWLPDIYLRLIQQLASEKKLDLVISDEQLVYGVSMPFKTVIVYNDGNLNPLIIKQMEGRGGRRGLDRTGNVIYVNFSWEELKELSYDNIPDIRQVENKLYTLDFAKELGGDEFRWDRLKINNFNEETDEESNEHYEGLSEYFSLCSSFMMDKILLLTVSPSKVIDRELSVGDRIIVKHNNVPCSCIILEMSSNPIIKVKLDNNKEIKIKKNDILSKKYKVSEYMEYDCTILDKNETNIRIKLKDFELFWMLWRYRKNTWARMIARIIPEIAKEFAHVDPEKEKNQFISKKNIL